MFYTITKKRNEFDTMDTISILTKVLDRNYGVSARLPKNCSLSEELNILNNLVTELDRELRSMF